MHVKKLGHIPEGGGRRAHGRGNTGLDTKRRNWFDFVHSLVDDHCRLAYSEILPDEKGLTSAGFLRRAAEYFHSHGIATIEQVMTDNAWAYRYSLRQACTELGARQVFITPHCPGRTAR
jgi:Integrase core domain